MQKRVALRLQRWVLHSPSVAYICSNRAIALEKTEFRALGGEVMGVQGAIRIPSWAKAAAGINQGSFTEVNKDKSMC